MSSNVACTSNGVVSLSQFVTKFRYCCGNRFLNDSGKVKLKNGNRSSCFPCNVLRTSENLLKKSLQMFKNCL